MRRPFASVAATDVRALLPVWGASALTILAESVLRGTPLRSFPLGMFAYIVGSIALGAHAIGHEYTNRTLPALLVQPWKRSSMLLTKAAVLAVMLLALALVAWPVLFRAEPRAFGLFGRRWPLVLPFAGGLFVAPYLSMQLRSQMAAIVFTASIPGTTYLLALLVGLSIYGTDGNAAGQLVVTIWPPAMVFFAAAGAVLSARSFMRLQAIDGGREELQLPRWVAAIDDGNPVRPPLWMLVKKELRLQQMTFALVAFYVVIWTALAIAGWLNPQFAKDFPIRGVGVLYFALLPLLIGSLASAQERQFGTLESQSMLPVPFAHQWAVKAGVVLVLALTLGVLLPWIVFAPPQLSTDAWWPLATAVVLLTTWSLYISSWCGSGVIALALILPASAAAMVAARLVDVIMTWMLVPQHAAGLYPVLTSPSTLFTLWALIGTPIVVLLLVFAGRNHRSLERKPRTLAVQVAWLAGFLIVSDFVTVIL